MQFQVPQFTNVEDKIFGPLTLKQFVYIGGGVGLGFLAWNYIPGILALPIALLAAGSGAALAFVEINKKPLIVMLEAAFLYIINGKLYLWDAHRKEKEKEATVALPSEQSQEVPALSQNKLESLAWSLDINERIRVDAQREANAAQ